MARFDEHLVSRFHLLYEETGELATPPVFVTFDCLWRRGRETVLTLLRMFCGLVNHAEVRPEFGLEPTAFSKAFLLEFVGHVTQALCGLAS